MKDYPILFSGEMVCNILEGRKTQTRRVINPQPRELPVLCGDGRWRSENGTPGFRCRYGKPGDHLWVRETFCDVNAELIPLKKKVYYRADKEISPLMKWRPSIYMPRWASRITLEVVKVRVERLQDISEADARAEGVPQCPAYTKTDTPYKKEFERVWDEINGKRGYGWSVNPFVWVIEFRKL